MILLIHEQAIISIQHGGQVAHIALRRGCGLAPILWTLFSAWVLKRMQNPSIGGVCQAATVYADDNHFSWTIRRGQDLEHAYRAIKHVISCLVEHGLQVSIAKTAVLLELHGPHASKTAERYIVHLPEGAPLENNHGSWPSYASKNSC